MQTLYTERTKNIGKSFLLVTLFLVFIIGLGWVFSAVYQSSAILVIAVVISVVMSIASYWWSDKIVMRLARAVPAKMENFAELYRIVENLAITAGLPMPRMYVVSDPAPNAFATGRNAAHAAVAVTTGLLDRLDRTELEGVLAHELSHIGNRDMLLSSMVVVLVGVVAIASDFFLRSSFWMGAGRDRENRNGNILMIVGIILAILSPIIASLIQLAISRRREFLADTSGALLTRYPEGLASALKKIAADPRPLRAASNATAHLYFENPFKADVAAGKKTPWFVKIFMTHPPVEERIKALEGLDLGSHE